MSSLYIVMNQEPTHYVKDLQQNTIFNVGYILLNGTSVNE